ncbi:MAG: ATP-binding protein [Phycisphaerae bacterium]
MASFFVLQGPDKGRSLRSAEDRILIGRTSDQVPLTDHTVSRRHAQVDAAEGGWVLSDLDSANGTYVNGVRVTRPVKLKHGDQIRVGSTLLVYAGDERVEQLLGPNIPTDLVTLDAGESLDASIMASVPSNEDSVVMAAPDTAWAVKSWGVIRQLTDVIGSLLPTDQLLARVMDIIFEEVEVDRGVIFVRDAQTQELMPEVVRFRERAGGAPRGRDGDSIQTSRTILDHVARSREGVLCSNVAADKRFQSGKSVHNLGMRSVICAPIVAREQVLGVVHLDCPVPRHTYNENELRLITAIGYQTGLAIENARLVQSHLERERLAAAGETVAYLSHYIKNILQGMRSGADVVKRGLDRRDFAVTSQGWHIVERNLEKSYNLMLNMLAFSKEREPRFEMLQLNKIVDEVVDLAQRPADDRKAVLLADLDEHVPAIPLDYDGIHQVTLNLITNALEIVPPGNGIVNVRTRYDAATRQVLLAVADNGPGVPPQNQQRIFEPFFSTKGHGGTGLGLAVAKKIVEELGGTIEVRNQPEGGAEFRVKLPAFNARMEQAGDTLGPR